MVDKIRVIALGSSHGDDQAAWWAANRLRADDSLAWDIVTLEEATQIVDHLEDCEQVLIMDACSSGAAPGTITRLAWPDERLRKRGGGSTHGMSVGEALCLAERLGRLPHKVTLFGIEIEQTSPGAPLSPTVEQALPGLMRELMRECHAGEQVQGPRK